MSCARVRDLRFGKKYKIRKILTGGRLYGLLPELEVGEINQPKILDLGVMFSGTATDAHGLFYSTAGPREMKEAQANCRGLSSKLMSTQLSLNLRANAFL